jgi:hypothetical protein
MRPFIVSTVGALLFLASFGAVASAQESTSDCSQFGVVRILNTSPDAGGIDVLINGQKVATNVQFQASPVVTPVGTGVFQIEIRATGADRVLVSGVSLSVTPFSHTTVVVSGQLVGAGQQPKSTITTQVFPDDATAPAAGQARVRVIHSSSDLGPVDVLIGETRVATNLAFPNASPAVDVPAGAATIRVVATGTTTDVISPVEQSLVARRTYTIYTTGLKSANNLATNVVVDRAFDAEARFVHNAPGSPPIDVLVDGAKIVDNLSYPNFVPSSGEHVPLPAGGACVLLASSGETSQALATTALDLPSATRWTIVAMGLPGAVTVERYPDALELPPSEIARCRMVQGIPDVGPVDLYAGNQKLISNLGYAQISPYLDIPQGTYTLRVTKAGTDETILGPLDFTFGEGQLMTWIIRGTAEQKDTGVIILNDTAGN